MMKQFSLKGQSFVLRPLVQADAGKYQVFFNTLSEESIHCRFGHLLAKLSEGEAARRTHGDVENERALAVFDGPQEKIVAIGRCYLDRRAAEAEIALVVAETMRCLGLGRWLLDQLVQVARDEKIRSINAFIATRNAPVLMLLESAGFVRERLNTGDDLKLVLEVQESEQKGMQPSGLGTSGLVQRQ